MLSFDVSTSAEFAALRVVLSSLADQVSASATSMLVVGAVARDLLTTSVTGGQPARATADIDVAIAVDSWERYERLVAQLNAAGGSSHTFRVLGIPVDVIPYGDIEAEDRSITWPDDHVMNVLGFREAAETAVVVHLGQGRTVAVASLPAQVVLKLLAWRDRRQTTTRDAIDLRSIITAYGDGPYLTELYDDHEDCLERADFDTELAGADRIGYEAVARLRDADRYVLVDLVTHECGDDGTLPAAMSRLTARNRAILTSLLTGMRRASDQPFPK
jgi:predicted nucleotidyltransferase